VKRVVTLKVRSRSASVTPHPYEQDAWLSMATPRGPSTWPEVKRHFRALRMPDDVCETLQHWGVSPNELKPLLRLVREIVFSNAIHRAAIDRATWAAGMARDPHYNLTPEDPGALRPLLDIVERVIADLERLIQWKFMPPIVLHELDKKLKRTRRTVCLSRLDETVREVFSKARKELLGVRAELRKDTLRPHGRKATLVQPRAVSTRRASEPAKPARRRELMRLIRTQILALHPNRTKPSRAARATAGRLAGDIIDAIPVVN